jgi:rod shape-determining protein MreD
VTEISSDQLIKPPTEQDTWLSRFQALVLILLTLIAIAGKFYLPRLVPHTEWLELPLLLTVYFGLMRQSQIQALFFGAFVGLAEDSLSPVTLHPIGMYGISKTLVGYFAASVSTKFNVENWFIRVVLCLFFYCFHSFFYWIMRRALLGQTISFDPQEMLIDAVLNAVIAIPLFAVLDRIRVSVRE